LGFEIDSLFNRAILNVSKLASRYSLPCLVGSGKTGSGANALRFPQDKIMRVNAVNRNDFMITVQFVNI
jgi:hypothetical protein